MGLEVTASKTRVMLSDSIVFHIKDDPQYTEHHCSYIYNDSVWGSWDAPTGSDVDLVFEFTPYIWGDRFGAKSREVKAEFRIVRSADMSASQAFEITVTLDGYAPALPQVKLTVSPVTDLPAPFDTVYIRWLTDISFEISATAFGLATITKLEQKYGRGNASWFPVTDGTYRSQISATDAVYRFRATDSRGYVAETEFSPEVIPYDYPRVVHGRNGRLECYRCDASGNADRSGTSVRIIAGRSYSKVTINGKQENFCVLRYRIKQKGQGYSGWTELIPASSVAEDSADYVAVNAAPELRKEYTIQLEVQDTVGKKNSYTIQIPTDLVPLHLGEGGKNIGIGQYCDYSHTEAVDIGWKIFANGGINLAEVFRVGFGQGPKENKLIDTVVPAAKLEPLRNASFVVAFVAKHPKNSVENYLAGSTLFLSRIRSGNYSSFRGAGVMNMGTDSSGDQKDMVPFDFSLVEYDQSYFFAIDCVPEKPGSTKNGIEMMELYVLF